MEQRLPTEIKIVLSTPSGDLESKTENIWRESVSRGGTETMELDPTWTKIH